MALLNKLFNNKRRNCKQQFKVNDLFESSSWNAPDFNKDQIRVMVFRECSWRGRKLLFDLKSLKKTQLGNRNTTGACRQFHKQCVPDSTASEKCVGYTEVTHNGMVYQYLKPRPDVKMLGEMIFGSVAMSYKGESMKIHAIRAPPQLMFSKVFPAPVHGKTDSEQELESSFQNSMTESMSVQLKVSRENDFTAQSIPVDVPVLSTSLDDGLELITPSSLRSNNSFSSVRSFQRSPEGSTGNLSNLTRSGSYNSLHRRWHRTLTTSLEFGLRRKSDENGGNKEERRFPNNRRTKLGVSVIVTLGEVEEQEKHFQAFFFSHIALIENYINKLCMSVERAYVDRRHFVQLVVEAVEVLLQCLHDLYTAPRFPKPVWLSLMTQGSRHHAICLHYVTEFMALLDLCDTKSTNFFVSTLLTAVLMHHLSWVPTVTPPGVLPSHSFHEKHTAKWLDMLAKSHPYNPLWVQLGDLYGALGFPCKMARTVIVGCDKGLVRRIIYCLTYFIRCCEVYENVESRSVDPGGGVSTPRHNAVLLSTSSGSTLVGELVHSPPPPSKCCSISGDRRDNASDRKVASLSSFVEVERQEGEGDDDDDEVFHSEAKRQEDACLRTGRPSCHRCGLATCSCRKTFRHGVVYCDKHSESREDNGWSACGERDSGIYNGFTEAAASDRGKWRRAVSSASGKVTFSIGSIPLQEICRKEAKERSPPDEALVCTCGRHAPAGKSFVKVGVESATEPEVHTWAESRHSSGLATWDKWPSLTKAHTSLSCDSGIHSCDASSTDLDNGTTSKVRMVDVNIPDVKLEHVRNVGSTTVTDATDFIGLPGGSRVHVASNGVAAHAKSRPKFFDYERTNSMFDEYFDENIELNMLDEEDFQQTLKSRRTKVVNGGPRWHKPDERRVLWNAMDGGTEFLDDLVQLQIPKSETSQIQDGATNYVHGFGRSLASNYVDRYLPDFALQGTSEASFGAKLIDDLKLALQSPVLDEPVAEAVCIVADTLNWNIELVSSKSGVVDQSGAPRGTRVTMSQLVASMAESLMHLWRLKMSPEFCLMHLEDRLQEFYFKSRLLAEYFLEMQPLGVQSLSAALGVDASDLPLLMAIASTHTPEVTCAYSLAYR